MDLDSETSSKETQTILGENHQEIINNLKIENEELKSRIDVLDNQLEEIGSYTKPGVPSSKEDIAEFLKAYKATEIQLKQKCLEFAKLEESKNELRVRFELEHERRLRAQKEIGHIEKEKVILQKDLETKSGECVKLSEECDEIKSNCEFKISKYTAEVKKIESKLEKVQLEKDKKIFDLQDKNTELYLKLETAEETNATNMEVATTLQNELQSSYAETQSLVKEMEMLNLMFAELDQHIFPTEIAPKADVNNLEVTENGKQVNVNEVLNVAQNTDYSPSLLQKSCFNEVTTKHGTKMVLSVSKTFLKLKDLILEKNTLEEQMSKMKHINDTLCKQVNIHEEKLCGITDELNNTWFYVSKIKEQHKKMHSAEQILRAELAEKRQLLKNIRKELEETRASWNIVKQKNAESEIQWLKLKADCEERRRILMSSSESGFSELGISETENDKTDTEAETSAATPDINQAQSEKSLSPVFREIDEEEEEESESEEIPDPFSDDENEVEDIPQHFVLPVVATNVNEDTDEDEEEEELSVVEAEAEEVSEDPTFTPIFVPSMSYLAQVPTEMQPELLSPNEKEIRALEEIKPSRERLDENVLEEEVDDNVRDLIIRLSSSTARGAFLANRLAHIHRSIASGSSLTEHNQWFSDQIDEEETETDIFPKEEEEEDEVTVPSPEIQSDFDDVVPIPHDDSMDDNDEIDDNDDTDNLDEISRPSSVDSLVLAIDEAINILDPVNSHPQLQSFLSVSSSTSPPPPEIRPTFLTTDNNEDDDEDVDDSTNDLLTAVMGNENNEASTDDAPQVTISAGAPVQDSSTAVTRYLIKHLPKQLTQLRNQKHELEDKIHDLEQVVSEQRSQMMEYERRAEMEKSKAKKLEESLSEIEEKVVASEARIDNVILPVTYKVPVLVETEEMLLTWTVDTQSENVCGYYISFVTRGDSGDNAVILPNIVSEVIPSSMGIITSLQCPCSYKGTYTLHIEGNGSKMPQVTVNLVPIDDNGKSEKSL